MANTNTRLIYSTDGTTAGRLVAKGGPMPAARSTSPSPAPGRAGLGVSSAPPFNDGIVRIQRTSKGRRGKTVTTITGLPGSATDLGNLLKVLKQHCGAGGTRDTSALEIQGDHRDRIVAWLEANGHNVKLVGG